MWQRVSWIFTNYSFSTRLAVLKSSYRWNFFLHYVLWSAWNFYKRFFAFLKKKVLAWTFFSPVCFKEMGNLIFFKFLIVCTTCLSLTIYESPIRTWNSDMLNFYYISMTFKKHNEELLSFFNNAPLHGTGFLLYLKDGDLGVKFTLLSVQK